MLYREVIAVCSEVHTKHINTLFGQNVEFVNVKRGGTYSNHPAVCKDYSISIQLIRNKVKFQAPAYRVLTLESSQSLSFGAARCLPPSVPEAPPQDTILRRTHPTDIDLPSKRTTSKTICHPHYRLFLSCCLSV